MWGPIFLGGIGGVKRRVEMEPYVDA